MIHHKFTLPRLLSRYLESQVVALALSKQSVKILISFLLSVHAIQRYLGVT
jgi:hypothetical protein